MAKEKVKTKKELIEESATYRKENILLKKRIKQEANIILYLYNIVLKYDNFNEILN